MKNVTVTLPEKTLKWVRIEAAKREKSVSKFLGHILEERMHHDETYGLGMHRFLSRPPLPLREAGTKLPSRDSLYTR
jgi:hypothetical protein